MFKGVEDYGNPEGLQPGSKIVFTAGDFGRVHNIETDSIPTRFDRLGIKNGAKQVPDPEKEGSFLVEVTESAVIELFKNASDNQEKDAVILVDLLISYVANKSTFGSLSMLLPRLAAGQELNEAQRASMEAALPEAIIKLKNLAEVIKIITKAATQLTPQSRAAFDYLDAVGEGKDKTSVVKNKLHDLADVFNNMATQLGKMVAGANEDKAKDFAKAAGAIKEASKALHLVLTRVA